MTKRAKDMTRRDVLKLTGAATVLAATGLATAAHGSRADTAVRPGGTFESVEINAQTGTGYTPVLGDGGKLITLDNAAAITLTVPANASVAFPIGTVLTFAQFGVGLVSILAETGVTVNGVTPGVEASAGQWSAWSLTKVATDTWFASGGIA